MDLNRLSSAVEVSGGHMYAIAAPANNFDGQFKTFIFGTSQGHAWSNMLSQFELGHQSFGEYVRSSSFQATLHRISTRAAYLTDREFQVPPPAIAVERVDVDPNITLQPIALDVNPSTYQELEPGHTIDIDPNNNSPPIPTNNYIEIPSILVANCNLNNSVSYRPSTTSGSTTLGLSSEPSINTGVPHVQIPDHIQPAAEETNLLIISANNRQKKGKKRDAERSWIQEQIRQMFYDKTFMMGSSKYMTKSPSPPWDEKGGVLEKFHLELILPNQWTIEMVSGRRNNKRTSAEHKRLFEELQREPRRIMLVTRRPILRAPLTSESEPSPAPSRHIHMLTNI